MAEKLKTGLILTGGGARAAYQVGVLQAISDILYDNGWVPERNPFDIICGTSAGAINATALACCSDQFDEGIGHLLKVWNGLSVEQVYRADSLGVMRSGAKWLSLLSFGWVLRKWHASPPNALLDNTPLITLLHRTLDLPRLDAALRDGHLHALAVTASSYTAGDHVTFYQSVDGIAPWQRTQRRSVRDQIGVDHLLASAAIPFIFPSMPLYCEGRQEYFGDGSMRQLAPISPAIHLGADKVVVIGSGRLSEPPQHRCVAGQYPTLAQIAGHAMSSIFLDSLAADIETLDRTNRTVSVLNEEQQRTLGLRRIDMLSISPSERLDDIAMQHVGDLPAPIRALLSGIGATETRGSALASYLLFQASYTRELIALGNKDGHLRRNDVLRFFGCPVMSTAEESATTG